MSAYFVPSDEEPAAAPEFNLEVLSNSRGWLEWVSELVLGVDLADIDTPRFSAQVGRAQTSLCNEEVLQELGITGQHRQLCIHNVEGSGT